MSQAELNNVKASESDGLIVLGEKLENPYSVKNMQKAYDNLKNSGTKSASNIEITATHFYVKFKPKNEEELSILESDTTLITYDFPLDHDILQNGDYYHDPTLPVSQPTFQYASVKIGKELPVEVAYEILSELFIPDEDKDEESTSLTKAIKAFKNNNLIEELVDEALRITNNIEDEKNELSIRTKGLFSRRSKWRPAGRIQVWDDNIGQSTTTKRIFSHWEYYDCEDDLPIETEMLELREERTTERQHRLQRSVKRCKRAVYKYVSTTNNGSYVPVEGAKVRARRWFTTHTGIVNPKGYYSCDGRFRRPANYKIKWKRSDFSIRWSALSSAKYNGSKRKGDWNLNIKGGTQEYYATIFRAAHHYYYKDIKGLRRPPQNSFWRTQLKIRAFKQNVSEDGSLGTHQREWRAFGLWSPIKIYTYKRPAIDTYSTVIHELAHSSHWNMDRSDFKDTESKVKESWARGVEWELTRMVYSNYRTPEIRPDYTLVVMDMIDNDNRFGNTFTLGELVEGYAIRQIEDALDGQKSWANWRNNIKNKYNNETENNLDALFNYWSN